MIGMAADKEAVRAFDWQVVDPSVVDNYLLHYKLAGAGTIEEKVKRLAEATKKVTPPDNLAQCDRCGGWSDVTLDRCPYCGDGETIHEVALASSEESMLVKTEKNKKTKAGSKPNGIANSNGASNGTAMKLASRAEVLEGKFESESDLDAAVDLVIRLKNKAAANYWDIGKALFDIYEHQLHTQRMNDDGAPRYKHWNQFVASEIGITPSYSYKLMDLAKAALREDVEMLGTTKMALMLRLPDGVRHDMLEKAKKGMPRSKIVEEVRRHAGGARDTGRKGFRGGKPNTAGSKPRPPRDAPAGAITVAMVTARHKIPLFARTKGKDEKPTKRAMRLSDEPRGVWQLSNGVEVGITITTDAKGQLIAVVDCHRTAT